MITLGIVPDYQTLQKLAVENNCCEKCFSELVNGICPFNCQHRPLRLLKKPSILRKNRRRRCLAKPKIVKKSV